MVLKTRVLALTVTLLISIAGSSVLHAADGPRPGEVMLPLKDYLSLVETVERLDRERTQRQARREEPLAEVISQRLRIVLQEETADVTSEFEVLVQGEPKGPVPLPIAGVPLEVEAKTLGVAVPTAGPAAAAVTAGAKEGELRLVAPGPGRYAVKVSGPLWIGKGVSRISLPAAAAPVAVTEIDLPADRAFDAPGAVIVEDRTEGGRRRIQLTTRRGEAQVVEVRRKVDGSEAEKLLAQSVVLTLVQLLPDGPRRHDVVLYEISRGGLGSFTVDLPPGLAVEQAGTDEGNVIPVVESRRLTINRRNQLRGTGYLVLTSTPSPGAEVSLEPVVPETEVRARYLALASAVAADAHPLPQASWSRVDLDDLPPALREALSSIDLAAAWRLSGAPNGGKMAVAVLPLAPSLPLLVERRETTTLLTVDGTLLHRDRLVLRPPGGLGAALDVVLPATAKLWSTKVDEVPVRPLNRGNGTISIPLGFETGKEPVIEIVSVLDKAIPPGRSELALTLPQIAVPVQAHEWRVLLPDGAKYRFRSSELRPASPARNPWSTLQSPPGVLTDRINVGGNEAGQQSSYVGPGGSASIYGKVMDDRGATLPGVTIALSGAVVVTDAQGAFAVRGLPAGTYSLKAELEGFSPIEYPNVKLVTGQSVTLEIRMSAAVEDVITVTAETPMLDERKIGNTTTTTLNEGGSGPGAYDLDKRRREKDKETAREEQQKKALFAQEARGLQQGLVGGVKPLPIAIPESGKVLFLTGVLPPVKVGVELEVKGKR
ncbi:MAG TPA: carboxypeptidase-like regulatory domain-containing protein [Thermoanaerobaculia bacterium]|nr:carboxypeptidase-like regulatory domain-containing protein [Thermoanaerobaculia bacterium]